jgi:A/G-specific adenine glycosylase
MGQIEHWFEENKRDFPWRKEKTPYRVWISEVMLQQTRASVVIPYFLRWMEKFPDVKALYNASIEEVIKAWEGLGYYSRARNLHRAAKQIVEDFGGVIPNTEEALRSLQGFGSYTTGAVLSFAFHKRSIAVDGNVLRVIARYFCVEENVSQNGTRRKIEESVETILDPKTPWVTMEALIELGATICSQKPRCEMCPLQEGCLGRKKGLAESLPIKNIEKEIIPLFRAVLVLEKDGFVLVKKEESGKVMAGLYEFPYVESSKEKYMEEVSKIVGKRKMVRLPSCTHTFTRYKAHLFPFWIQVESSFQEFGSEWVKISQLSTLPFSSGHRKILAEVEKIYRHG